MSNNLSFDYLEQFKDQSNALRLLRTSTFPLIASFFYRAFIENNRRSMPYQELIALLDHHLSDIAESYGEEKFPKSARAYIDDWVNVKGGYLRKYLPQHTDEPECDLQPDVEKALRWLEEMQGRRFVGTESRLKLLLDLITELVQGTSQDQAVKLALLQDKKVEIEQQISSVEQGLDSSFSETEVRERVFLLADMSRQLLGDFRQVEANFRHLDKDIRKKITLGGAHKGLVLDKVFSEQDVIDGSDEGKSFNSFFELLMTPEMRENMRGDLKKLLDHQQGDEQFSEDQLLQHLYSYLLDAGVKVNNTKLQITDQLRRYIQEQSQDNKRILEMIREFEAGAHRLEADNDKKNHSFAQIDGIQADISTLFSRRLYKPQAEEQLDSTLISASDAPEVDLSHLFDVSHIDELKLLRNIGHCLQQESQNQQKGQVTLAQVIEAHPIEYGLDEVLTYIKLACEQVVPAHIDSEQLQDISWQVASETDAQLIHRLKAPIITFVRE
ncbi:DUF3375 domain-containing protein [Psychromonas sp.]|uniref:DUF3375 domain-containing protein n=1 Tax=Psychromonas sp. TaxID=1884585 RepID=UPI003563DC0F